MKPILEATQVYWMPLAWILKVILSIIQQIFCRFLWKGSKEGHTFAWTRWDLITLPKKWGGWGLKYLSCFSRTLASKLGCKILTTDNLCTKVVTNKYINPLWPIEWIWSPSMNMACISLVWCGILNFVDYVWNGLAWIIGLGWKVHIGKDPWSCYGNAYFLSHGLIRFLEQVGIKTLDHIVDSVNTSISPKPRNWCSILTSLLNGIKNGQYTLVHSQNLILEFLTRTMNSYVSSHNMEGTQLRMDMLVCVIFFPWLAQVVNRGVRRGGKAPLHCADYVAGGCHRGFEA